jgi:FeS assembly SUF system protein
MAVTEEQVIEVLRECFDPEIPVNVYDLGLVYNIDVRDDTVFVEMTLTAPGCPVAGTMGPEIQMKLLGIEGVNDAQVEMVWEPSWTPDMIRPEGREILAGLI